MNAKRHQLRNWALAFVVNFMWAAQYPAYKVASDAMGQGALNFWTFIIATLVLAPFLIAERRRGTARGLRREALWPFLWLSVLGVIPPSVIQSWGIAHSTASNGSILALTIPVMMVGMAVLLLKERPQKFFLISLALALLGTALISWADIASGSFAGKLLLGNLAILFGGAGAAFYNAYGKKLLETHTEMQTLVYGYVVAIVLCAIISLIWDPVPFYHVTSWPLRAWVGVVVLGVMSWGIGMVIWFWLLKQLELTQISVSVYMLPVLGVLLSAITLGERLSLMQIVGGVVVLGSAYLCSGQSEPNKHA